MFFGINPSMLNVFEDEIKYNGTAKLAQAVLFS